MFVSVRVRRAEIVTDSRNGAIGVDINSDHLAVSETDPHGNWVSSWRIPLVTYGKSRGQASALIGEAIAGLGRVHTNAVHRE